MFCMQCGTKLPEDAKFCFSCGTKVELPLTEAQTSPQDDLWGGIQTASQDDPWGEIQTSPKVDDPWSGFKTTSQVEQSEQPMSQDGELAEIFASLDSVTCHSEYYYNIQNPMKNYYRMAANQGWVLKEEEREHSYILMDENGENQRKIDVSLKLRKNEYACLMGFNTKGIWFIICVDGDSYSNKKFLCVDVVNSKTVEYPIERQKGEISDVYIYDDEVYYINKVTENKQILYRQTSYGCTELMNTRKDEWIGRLSADANRIAWGFINKENYNFWYIRNKDTGKQNIITVPMRTDKPWLPMLKIHSVNLNRNMMYTTLTEGEARRFGKECESIAIRRLADPIEGQILTKKSDGSSMEIVWTIENSSYYFDGIVFYHIPHYSKIVRSDWKGTKYCLGGTGHGECDKIIVTDKWLYINYDAYDMVRLPKRFNEFIGEASDNPEAFFIFGKGKDFRM